MKYPEFPTYATGIYPERAEVYVFPAYSSADLFCIEVTTDKADRGKFSCTAYHGDKLIDVPKDAMVREVIKRNLAAIMHVMLQIGIPRCVAYYDRKSKKFVEFLDNMNRFISPGFAIDLFSKIVDLLPPIDVVTIVDKSDLDKYENVIFKPAPMSKAFGSDKLTYSRR